MSRNKYMYDVVEESGWFLLVEKKSCNVVEKHRDTYSAKKRAKFMSSGGAFNTFTPRFLCISCYPDYQELSLIEDLVLSEKSDLNRNFQDLLVPQQ